MHSVATRLLQIPDEPEHPNSQSVVKHLSRLNSFVLPDHLRNFLTSFLARKILAHPGTHSVTLRLPDSLRVVHPVFHVSMLEPAFPNPIPDRVQPPPPPILVNDEPEFEISEILDSKIDNRRRACKLLYLVRWTGYEGTNEETSWILMSELGHASELVTDFHASYPAKPGPLPSLS